jgi:ABC-type bacteriocin/lantibiotic exporter with double-glycine peptidase domain
VTALNHVVLSTELSKQPIENIEVAIPANIETIRLEKINYSYDSMRIFENLTIEFYPGILNAIKGPTGVGKSTLLRLLKGDLQPESGQIWCGRLNLGRDLQYMRRNVSLVTQFPKLFTASLKDNITLFDRNFDAELFQKSMEISLTRDFSDELPKGVETMIGPNAMRLSGGQMQSVAIARALYANTKILLLDEPTASFDNHREKEFLHRLRNILHGRLVVITSHKSQSIDAADHLIDLDSV